MPRASAQQSNSLGVWLAILPLLTAFLTCLVLSSIDTDKLGYAALVVNPIVTPIIIVIPTCMLCLFVSFIRNKTNPNRHLQWYDYLGYSYQTLTVFCSAITLFLLFSQP